MGKSIIAAVLLCVLFAANAEQLVVDYSGTVSSIDRAFLADAPPYSVGDPISGRLIIDTAAAPADRLASDPSIGRYYGGSSTGLDFIFGATHPRASAPSDLLLVYNDWNPPSTGAPREDGIIVSDSSGNTDGKFNLLLGFQRPNSFGQVFADDSLSQSFVVEREPGTKLWGHIEQGFGEFWSIVNFSLDRLSVTPRVCHP